MHSAVAFIVHHISASSECNEAASSFPRVKSRAAGEERSAATLVLRLDVAFSFTNEKSNHFSRVCEMKCRTSVVVRMIVAHSTLNAEFCGFDVVAFCSG